MLKEQAAEILKDIPDEKVAAVIEILNELRAPYNQSEKTETHSEVSISAMGIFNKYANPDLIPLEKKAWSEAVKEKYAAH